MSRLFLIIYLKISVFSIYQNTTSLGKMKILPLEQDHYELTLLTNHGV